VECGELGIQRAASYKGILEGVRRQLVAGPKEESRGEERKSWILVVVVKAAMIAFAMDPGARRRVSKTGPHHFAARTPW
jgi:hypothetical protein